MRGRGGALLVALLAAACAAAAAAAAASEVTTGPRGLSCPAPTPRPAPTSVRDLRPQDVRLVAAVGDSITAAFAVEGGLWEYRDESWSVGGGPNKTTLFNYVKAFSPSVAGASTVDHFPELHHTKHAFPSDHLNAAQSGAVVADVADEQVAYLVAQLNATKGAATAWKVLTVFIMANDVCKACGDSAETVASFSDNYDAFLAKIQAEIDYVFVNLVTLMPLSALAKLTHASTDCTFEHSFLHECHCVFKGNSTDWAEMDTYTDGYNAAIHKLAAKYNAMDDTHAYVVQPFLEKSIIPDLSYVSTLDCFHPSLKAHSDMGTLLWNQMLLPAANKTSGGLPSGQWFQEPVCPGDGVFYSS